MKIARPDQKHIRGFAIQGVLAFLFLLTFGEIILAQNESYTPLAIKPGSPPVSYALTDIDTVNLFSGRVNVRFPLMNRMGRGDAKANVTLTRDSPSRFQIFKSYDTYGNEMLGTGGGGAFNIPPGREGEITVYPQGVGTGAQNWCAEGLYTWSEKTLTRFFWVEPNGTEHEMRDVLTGGQPLQSGGCWTAGPYRGRVFASTDGSGATFITDVAVRDGIYVDQEYPVSYIRKLCMSE